MPLEDRPTALISSSNLVVVGVKATSTLLPVHQAQVLSYLKIHQVPGGPCLINFNVPRLMDGVKLL